MICFVRRSTIDYDVRLKKYVDACASTNTPYIAVTWDRQGDSSSFYHEYQYKAKAPYGGGLKNLIQFVGFVFYLYWVLVLQFKKYNIIHACNLEIFILVFPFKFLGKSIIFDIYDSVNTKIESILCKRADVLILPHQKRLSQVGVSKDDINRFFVVENVPKFVSNIEIKKFDINNCQTHIRLSYVGVFERNIRGIENVLQLMMEDERLELHIAGIGAGMESLVEEYANKCNRIVYYGKVSYEKALEIMNNSHFIVALYYQANPLHKYASPNKFYESLYLAKPIITSLNTLVGDSVYEYNTGYVIDDDFVSLKSLFCNSNSEEFAEEYRAKSDNCSKLWSSKYKNYFDDVLKREYISLVNEL